MNDLKNSIEAIWNNRELLKEEENKAIIRHIINLLDKGELRVAEKNSE